jgi:hypothetical protein
MSPAAWIWICWRRAAIKPVFGVDPKDCGGPSTGQDNKISNYLKSRTFSRAVNLE